MNSATHNRSLLTIVKAIVEPANYRSVINTLSSCSAPIEYLVRYLTRSGSYPAQFEIKTPTGIVAPVAHSPDDILTINEIFFRGDYGDDRSATVIVDFGSNIGISTLYFLSRNAKSFVYCHEPLPQNIERLKANLSGFEDRYEVRQVAVAEQDKTAQFSWEPTGRYGHLSAEGSGTIPVVTVDSNRLLAEIIERHGEIDLLKIDIEGLEYRITARIPRGVAQKIRRIVVERHFQDNPLADTHGMSYRRPITTFLRRTC